jgi:hypothetical protein
MPGGDVSDLTLRRVAALRDEAKRDRLAVAALVAGLFPSTQQALDRLEAVLAAPDPPTGRTRRHRHLQQLSDDTRMWLREIQAPLQVMAAAERARQEQEVADAIEQHGEELARAIWELPSDFKSGGGDSSPASQTAGLSRDELLSVAGHTRPGFIPRDTLVRRAISDPGQFVARELKHSPPRWKGDTYRIEPLESWQARAVECALELHQMDAPPEARYKGYPMRLVLDIAGGPLDATDCLSFDAKAGTITLDTEKLDMKIVSGSTRDDRRVDDSRLRVRLPSRRGARRDEAEDVPRLRRARRPRGGPHHAPDRARLQPGRGD